MGPVTPGETRWPRCQKVSVARSTRPTQGSAVIRICVQPGVVESGRRAPPKRNPSPPPASGGRRLPARPASPRHVSDRLACTAPFLGKDDSATTPGPGTRTASVTLVHSSIWYFISDVMVVHGSPPFDSHQKPPWRPPRPARPPPGRAPTALSRFFAKAALTQFLRASPAWAVRAACRT